MKKTNLEIFNNSDTITITLNKEGREYMTSLLKENTNINVNDTELNAWYDTNNPDMDGDFMNEIPARYTKNNKPHTFTLSIEDHFDIKEV